MKLCEGAWLWKCERGLSKRAGQQPLKRAGEESGTFKLVKGCKTIKGRIVANMSYRILEKIQKHSKVAQSYVCCELSVSKEDLFRNS